MGVDETIGFSVKAPKTEMNEAIHNGFRLFCKEETKDDYTLGIKRLLEAYQTDWKHDVLMERILELTARIDALEKGEEKEQKEDEVTF